ncbi:phosphoribosyltransferase [Halobaculum sp. MBLA0147]|uniref:phosphoribosyltransferase n=1 Tax=Halobaculum sp. MBLA0147 TaxID=3079934 RepID=UPI0035246D83
MSDLPDEFDCTITNWEYIYDLCREVSDQVKADHFEPDVVVALARGGWFAGRVLCDFLGLDDLTSLKMEHYVGTGEKSGEPTVRYPMPEGSVDGKDVLIIDDIADTGGSIERAHEYVTDRGAGEVRTATLQLLQTSAFEPEFVGERLDEWAWIVYPWNFIEDMVDLISGVMAKDGDGPYDAGEIRGLLAEYHGVDRIEMEIAQPGRLREVLDEMGRRDVLAETDGEYTLVDGAVSGGTVETDGGTATGDETTDGGTATDEE